MGSEQSTETLAGSSGPKMAGHCLTGRLAEISVSEVLHFLSLNKKSGKLSLTRREGHGLIVLRKGQIIYAASSSVRETFGNILVCRGLVTEAVLTEALERQHWAEEGKRLGTLLVEMGHIRPEDVEDVVRYQVGLVVSELSRWADGFFRFEAIPVSQGEEIELDAQDFVVGDGLNTDRVLLEVAARLDEGRWEGPGGPEGSPDREPGGAEVAAESAPAAHSLEGLREELPAPTLRGETTLTLMRFATRTLNRGVLFVVRGDEADSISYFGLAAGREPGHDRPACLRLPLDGPSVVADVIQRKQTYRGALEPSTGNERLVQQLGGPRPIEVLAIPVVVGGSVAMVFYGDDVPHDRPIRAVRPLELLLTEAGLEMERDMLEGRIRSFERARRRQGP